MAQLKAPSFASVLRDTMHLYRVSRRHLSQTSGYDLSYISRLCSDQRRPTREAVLSLAAAMQCDALSTDRLLMAVGYLPVERGAVLLDEPIVWRAYVTLQDPAVQEIAKGCLRVTIADAVRQARLLRAEHESEEAAD